MVASSREDVTMLLQWFRKAGRRFLAPGAHPPGVD